jgi:hypothetical protein
MTIGTGVCETLVSVLNCFREELQAHDAHILAHRISYDLKHNRAPLVAIAKADHCDGNGRV